MTPITCPNPSCKLITYFPDGFDAFQRASDEFCPNCDTPLFWVPMAHNSLASLVPGADKARRRLPGAGPTGQAAIGSRACPECNERNTLKALFCYRCGADMNPKLPPPPPPPPPPTIEMPVEEEIIEPEPEPESWDWLIVAMLTIVITIALATWLG